jgi:alpha-amylase/alpha-mannosidase (GH57 family)
MEKIVKGRKYLTIHAHFYQPPRENPRSGDISTQDSAFPYNDWNERIARECYIPNAYARINDQMGRAVELVNNYEYLNFNFGPTLLTWLEKRYPAYYKKIIQSAVKSRMERGHSNAIAQAYNHSILPLASFNDQLTQVVWGLADFERRFGFKAEALWLPETAADDDTLRLLIDQGLRYAILSPYQAEKIRPLDSEKWTDVSSGQFETRRPYVWFDRSPDGKPIKNRSLAIFFYDGPLSKAVAFEGSLKNSESFAARLAAGFEHDAAHDQLLSIAVDGETFGHHHKFADMTLAHAFRHEIKRQNIETTNFSSYLDTHQPTYEAEIKTGPDGDGTAWSCAHGVRRWKGGCDCGQEGNGQTAWRMPLRASLNRLRDAACEAYTAQTQDLLKDIWRARNEYIILFSNPSRSGAESFLAAHSSRPLSQIEKTRVLKLLELQKNVNFMFTSCGWFFSDISRIESVQNLKYAALAATTLGEMGFKDVEHDFLTSLELAPSNCVDFENGRKVHEKLARPSAQSQETQAAFRLLEKFLFDLSGSIPAQVPYQGPMPIGRLFEPAVKSKGPELPITGQAHIKYTLLREEPAGSGELEIVTGELLVENSLNLETRTFSFLYARPNSELPLVFFSALENLEEFRRLSKKTEISSLREGAAALKASCVSFDDFSPEDKAAVIKGFIRSIRHKNRGLLAKIVNEYLSIFGKNTKIDLSAFTGIKYEVEIYAAEVFEILFDELSLSPDTALLDNIYSLANDLKLHRLTVRFPVPPLKAADCALAALGEALAAPSPENLDRLLKLLKISRSLGLHDAVFHLQNGLSELFAQVQTDPKQWAAHTEQIRELYNNSEIIIDRFSLKLDGLASTSKTL